MLFEKPGITVAYPLKSSKLNDRELATSVLSVLRFLDGEQINLLVVGDKPKCQMPSWAVHVPMKAHREPLRDAVLKIEAINSMVPSGDWVYMHDDQFAIKPFTVDSLKSPVLYTHKRSYLDWFPHNKWAEAKKHSMRVLHLDETWDTATHMPRVFETHRVTETLSRFRRVRQNWDFQIAYDAMHTPKESYLRTLDDTRFLRFERPTMTAVNLSMICRERVFINTGSLAFNNDVELFIQEQIRSEDSAKKPVSFEKTTIPIYDRCIHKGADTGQFVECGTCPSLTRKAPVFECKIHGVATTRVAKKPNSVYGRPMNCVQCFAGQQGFEASSNVQHG